MAEYDMNTVFSQYKNFIDSNYTRMKDDVELIIRQKQLSAIMKMTLSG